MKKLIFILTAMIQLFGCTAKERGDITCFHYDSHGAAMGSAISYEATLLDDGTVSLNVIRGAKTSVPTSIPRQLTALTAGRSSA